MLSKSVHLIMLFVDVQALKSLRKLNLNSTHLSALTFEGLKVSALEIWFIKFECLEIVVNTLWLHITMGLATCL